MIDENTQPVPEPTEQNDAQIVPLHTGYEPNAINLAENHGSDLNESIFNSSVERLQEQAEQAEAGLPGSEASLVISQRSQSGARASDIDIPFQEIEGFELDHGKVLVHLNENVKKHSAFKRLAGAVKENPKKSAEVAAGVTVAFTLAAFAIAGIRRRK